MVEGIVGLLGVAILPEVYPRKRQEAERDQGQQRQLQTVDEIRLHERNTLPSFFYSTPVAMSEQTVNGREQKGNRLRIREIRTFGSLICHPDSGGAP